MSSEEFEDLNDKHKKIRDNYKEIKSTHLEKLPSPVTSKATEGEAVNTPNPVALI